eukprot:TRINITY_DN2333_c0_g1_i4.p2 TRINITY_DN2333_c0_g1~~TRINITY_DN2333_c0_g1_i4.p2  ORF type:complete len:111 (+),score=16.15 TRINITY_DN2333_c0_g1_i4:107-439(+)
MILFRSQSLLSSLFSPLSRADEADQRVSFACAQQRRQTRSVVFVQRHSHTHLSRCLALTHVALVLFREQRSRCTSCAKGPTLSSFADASSCASEPQQLSFLFSVRIRCLA